MKKINWTTLLFLSLLCSAAQAQTQQNLIKNPGFDTDTSFWQWSHSMATGTDASAWIQGGKSLKVQLDSDTPTSGVSQAITGFQDGQKFSCSANMRIDSGSGTIELIVKYTFPSSPAVDHITNHTLTANEKGWQKLQLNTTVPQGASGMRVFCRFVGATTGNFFVDWVQLNPFSNFVTNGDFENGSTGWNVNSANGASIHSGLNDPFFEDKCLKLVGNSTGVAWASQYIQLGTLGDEPVYSLKYFVRTIQPAGPNPVMVVTPPETPTSNIDVDADSREIPEIEGSGANITIQCWADGKMIRKLNTPFFNGKISKMVEREVSFLVPEGTDSLIITAQVFKSAATARFDNIRITKKAVSDGNNFGPIGLYSDVGHTAAVVESPVPGTYVVPPGNDESDFQNAINNVTNSSHVDYGKTVWFPAGTYETRYIEVKTGLHLKMHRVAVLKRDGAPDTNTGFGSALVRNEADDFRISDVILEGGYYDRNATQGAPVAVSGDRVILRNWHIPSWSIPTPNPEPNSPPPTNYSSSAMWLFGHDTYVYHNTLANAGGGYNPAAGNIQDGFDGIHLWGGRRCHIMANDCKPGDDGIGLFTGTREFFVTVQERITIFDWSIGEVEAYNNRLHSDGARSFACGLARPRDFTPDGTLVGFKNSRRMKSVVENVRVRNFEGVCGGRVQLLAIICEPLNTYNDIALPQGAIEGAIVRKVKVSKGHVRGNLLVPYHDTTTYKQQAIMLYTSDVGTIEKASFIDINARNVEQSLLSIITAANNSAFSTHDGYNPAELRPNQGIFLEDCVLNGNRTIPANSQTTFLYYVEGANLDQAGNLDDLETENTLLGTGQKSFIDD